jgi:hypothetical protein
VSPTEFETWQEHNREFLALAVDDLRLRMDGGEDDPAEIELREASGAALESARTRMTHPPALAALVDVFQLDRFERDIVLLCIACELEPGLQAGQPTVTTGSVLESLPGAHWGALDEAAPLRRWGIVAVDGQAPVTAAPLWLARDIVRYLLGFDPRTGAGEVFLPPVQPVLGLPSQLEAARDLAATIALATSVNRLAPAVELHGATEEDRLAVAELCAAELDATITIADARDLPAAAEDLEDLLGRWNRWGPLTGTLLTITGADDQHDPATRYRVARVLHRIGRPFFLSVRTPTTIEPTRPLVRREAPELTVEERAAAWMACLDDATDRLGMTDSEPLRAEVAVLSTDFRVGPRTIERICLEAEALHAENAGADAGAADRLAAALREGCSRSVRARMDPLAERVPLQDVPDVALPGPEREQLAELERQIRRRHLVDVRWGMARGRDSGVTALFAGPSGTGKTHAAMALARRLGLDLYRVNVAGVLSKYIGETEQNLDRVFTAARSGGVILLFDEADALFGKRSEVKDAHDRYANLGTAYLLQRIESSPSPTILTTNLKEGMDPAFWGRLRFVVHFPFPHEDDRREMWGSIFPPQTPTRGLDPALLSQLAVTGGTISSIARRAAFLAADDGAIEMRHLLAGAFSELRKLDIEPSTQETAGWLRSA